MVLTLLAISWQNASFTEWQTATGQDVNSTTGIPCLIAPEWILLRSPRSISTVTRVPQFVQRPGLMYAFGGSNERR